MNSTPIGSRVMTDPASESSHCDFTFDWSLATPIIET